MTPDAPVLRRPEKGVRIAGSDDSSTHGAEKVRFHMKTDIGINKNYHKIA